MNKTLWPKIYSFFGFWTYKKVYIDHVNRTKSYHTIVYWVGFGRKFDLYRGSMVTETIRPEVYEMAYPDRVKRPEIGAI